VKEDNRCDKPVAKQKASVTLSRERVRRARNLTAYENLSELLDHALDAFIERELETRWLEGHQDEDAPAELPGEVAVDLGEVRWDEET
jgi:post-segregation antitoxin (ccd killing protein)